jgi:hypothetical protein
MLHGLMIPKPELRSETEGRMVRQGALFFVINLSAGNCTELFDVDR